MSASNVLKVLHMVSSLKVGGAERFVIDLCKEQMKDGIQPSVLSFGEKTDPLMRDCHEASIPVVSVEGNMARRQIKLIQTFLKQDILHIHSPSALRSSLVAIKLTGGKPVVYTRHGAAPLRGSRWKRMHNAIERQIGMVTFVSEEGKNNFMASYHWENKPHRVISNGVDIDELMQNVTPVTKDIARVRIGMVGRLIPLKSHITLFETLAELPSKYRDRIEVHIFGEGECQQSLEGFCKEHLETLKVTFHGNVTDRKRIYDSFDLLVMTSKTEGLSLAIIEAMAAGRPVLATPVGDTPLLVNEKTGWLFEYGDKEALAAILTSILDNPGVLNEYAERTQAHVHRHFSLQRASEEYSLAYDVVRS